jgi:imidazole glycerol-phosphate synthase subunit HisH
VHSYAATSLPLPKSDRMTAPLITWATHGEPFIAAVENGPLSATQFHPEKSGDAGAALLANWLESIQ